MKLLILGLFNLSGLFAATMIGGAAVYARIDFMTTLIGLSLIVAGVNNLCKLWRAK